MVDDRASPSAGWREVYGEMDVDADVEEPTRACPDCGRQCGNVLRDAYECEEHGVFRASAESPSADGDFASDDGSADADSVTVDGDDPHDAGETAEGGRDASDERTDRATGQAD